MNLFRVLIAGGLAAALPAFAVYAPVPEQDQGKAFTFSVKSGLSYDSNIFGGATGAIESAVFKFVPKASYNASLTDQTFMSLSYELTLDHIEDRPGDKLLDSHMVMARVAHAFSAATTIDVVEMFMAASSPESLLNGLPVNSDQSITLNQVDGSFTTTLAPKVGLSVKARTSQTSFRNATLARSLDRIENLYGLAGDYGVLANTKIIAEFRHQDVFYDKLGETKNKNSDFLMSGIDYTVAKKVTASGRVGLEWRHRASERSANVPFAEFTTKWDYAPESFITGGYMLTLEESSDTARFTDSRVNRYLVSIQHHVTALIVASGSLTFEPTVLKGRRGQPNLDESTLRLGGALSYLPTKNWIVSGSIDYDRTKSDEAARDTKRLRFGVNGSYTF
jgi:hypothetical protein